MVLKGSKLLLFIVALVFSLAYTEAQGQADSAMVWSNSDWQEASSGIEYRDKHEKKKEIEESNADETFEEDKPSLFWEKVKDFLESPAGKIILVTLAIGVLLTMILRMMGFRSFRSARVNSDIDVLIQSLEDDINAGPVSSALDIALKSGDYKSAVRLAYLSALQQLHQREFIQWKKNKTNSEYIAEIGNRKVANTFSELTNAYEVVWYGDRNIDEPAFKNIQVLANALSTELGEKRK